MSDVQLISCILHVEAYVCGIGYQLPHFLAFCINFTAAFTHLPFLDLGATSGVARVFLSRADNGTSSAIHIPVGFPFADGTENVTYVSVRPGKVDSQFIVPAGMLFWNYHVVFHVVLLNYTLHDGVFC